MSGEKEGLQGSGPGFLGSFFGVFLFFFLNYNQTCSPQIGFFLPDALTPERHTFFFLLKLDLY